MFSNDANFSSLAPKAAPKLASRGSMALVSTPVASSPTAKFANWLKVNGEGPATFLTMSKTSAAFLPLPVMAVSLELSDSKDTAASKAVLPSIPKPATVPAIATPPIAPRADPAPWAFCAT